LKERLLGRRFQVVIVVLIVLLAAWWFRSRTGEDEMDYRGEKIKLSKKYSDFSDYKNDPENIHPSETARVQRLVMEAPITHSFSNRLDVFRATGKIQFPGYGAGSGEGQRADGSPLLAVVIEIPRAGKDRYIVFHERQGAYELVDDFVAAEIAPPFRIREEDGAYVYYTQGNKETFRRPQP